MKRWLLTTGVRRWQVADDLSLDTWQKKYTGRPDLWFHDIFFGDGKIYRQSEVDYIKKMTGK